MAKTLLLADDSVTIQKVVELTFANEDIRVVAMGDGRRAVEWLDREVPDVVLADVTVPEVDGYALAEYVKASDRLRHVPVLLLAGAFEPVDDDRVRALGCEGVLVKPFEPQQLVARVRELLDREPGPAMAGVAVSAAEPTPGVEPVAGAAMAGATEAPFAAAGPFAEPEPLEPPVRPVWELGLPDPIHAPAPPVTPVPHQAVPPAVPGAPRVSLASAFTALLAAEQQSHVPAAQAAPITEATVEDAVRRVLVRMTDELVRRIVLETAERLIKEEIEKIKANPE